MSNTINRRKFFTDTAISAAGFMLGSNLVGCSSQRESDFSSYNIMQEVMKYRKIDTNAHVNPFNGDPVVLIDFAGRLGIEKLVISIPIESGSMSPKELIEYNDKVLKAMKQYPNRLIGKLTLNPAYPKE